MTYKETVKHSFIFIFFLILSNLLFVSDFSYMGVQDDSVSELIKSEFFGSILLQFSYLLFVYSMIAMIYAGILFRTSFIYTRKQLYLTLFTIHILLFHSRIIFTPAFFDEASKKYPPIRFYMEALTDYFSPYFFTFLVAIFVFVILLYSPRIKQVFWAILLLIILFSQLRLLGIPKNESDQANLLILSADSFRKADADSLKLFTGLEAYGRLLKHERMYTALPRTFPSWTSILTGKYPQNHYIFNMFPNGRQQALSNSTSLAEYLNKKGYRSTVISDFAGDIFSRGNYQFTAKKVPYFNIDVMINQGFLESQLNLFPYLFNPIAYFIFPELRGIAKFPKASQLKDETIEEFWQEEKFFITTFFSDAHFPYATAYPSYQIDDEYSGRFKYLKNQVLNKERTSDADRTHIKALFLAAEKSVKDNIDAILEELIRSSKIKNTIILFFSDHGENLFDYGGIIGHGEHLYDETTLNIPFYLFIPHAFYSGEQFLKKTASTVDILPSILDLLQMKIPERIDGSSLFEASSEAVFVESGLWFTNSNEEFYQKERISYPNVTDLLEIEWENDAQASLRSDYLPITEKAKHRLMINDSIKLMYIPQDSMVTWKLKRGESWKESVISDELKRQFFEHYKKRFTVKDDYLYLNNTYW